jgi:chromatin segregation and condensation protein Rec8/ScpA/Scc1 (kleisin family)
MDETADYLWFLDQANRLKTWSADLWLRTRRYYCELLRLQGIEVPEEDPFDKNYFAQKMSEARERRKNERMRRIGELLAQRSGPVVFDEPILLESVPGLTEALNSLVNIPIPIEIIHRFLGRDDFDLEGFQRHILTCLGDSVIAFDDLPPLLDQERKDRVFRFITLIFLAHTRKIVLWQEEERIWVKKNEIVTQGSGVSQKLEGIA